MKVYIVVPSCYIFGLTETDQLSDMDKGKFFQYLQRTWFKTSWPALEAGHFFSSNSSRRSTEQ